MLPAALLLVIGSLLMFLFNMHNAGVGGPFDVTSSVAFSIASFVMFFLAVSVAFGTTVSVHFQTLQCYVQHLVFSVGIMFSTKSVVTFNLIITFVSFSIVSVLFHYYVLCCCHWHGQYYCWVLLSAFLSCHFPAY